MVHWKKGITDGGSLFLFAKYFDDKDNLFLPARADATGGQCKGIVSPIPDAVQTFKRMRAFYSFY